MKNKAILTELIDKQRKNIPHEMKLLYCDFKRICKYIDGDIFNENECCIWNGYITNTNNLNKGTYINFYFRKKKVALHRLLYINFIGDLSSGEYLKFNCENKGRCCNIKHLKKFRYQKNDKTTSQEDKIVDEKNQGVKILFNESNLILNFD